VDNHWEDRGVVFSSDHRDDFNAIDPSVFVDDEGAHWMAFGSFWSGIKMIALDPTTGLRSQDDVRVRNLARRPSPGAVEAPFMIQRNGRYYLFVSFDFCCRGADSTYYTVVGRSGKPTGPFVDRDGTRMMRGGGFVVLHADLDPAGRFAGPGHVAVLRDGEVDYIVYHAYDTHADGRSTLRIQRLDWTDDGWPVAIR
jgi:arabinan endo-1,5-alpha-L-arabinosidase